MPNGFDLRGLAVPVIVAPMAGGPSTPELAAAALKRLQTSGMVTSEKYARGELFYIIA